MESPPNQDAFDLALQHHQAGRLDEAEQLYRQALVSDPEDADALHFLGVIAHQRGQNDVAIDLIGQAIALDPNYAEAHNNLGTALKGNGQIDEAIAAHRRAIALVPEYAEAYSNLGISLRDKGQFEEAIAACRQAIALTPALPEAHNNLGSALNGNGQFDEAIAAFRQALALNPQLAEAQNNLGIVLKIKGQLIEAIAAFRQAVELRPGYIKAYRNLGKALRENRQLDEALTAFRQAVFLSPNDAQGHNDLGIALRDKKEIDGALDELNQAVALKADFAEAYFNLGTVLVEKDRLDEALAAFRQAIVLEPNFAEAYRRIGTTLTDQGQLDEAIAAFQQAISIRPDYPEAHSSIIFTMLFHPAYDAQALAAELGRWNHLHAEPLGKFIREHSNDRSPDRRLRIGYVSPDLRSHVVGLNVLPLVREHDRQQVEIFCYANVGRPDQVTSRFQQAADHWRDILALSDEQVADRIREDRIDILVDLALHMPGNRLLVFARKPAPVQATFAGYPGSTGVSAIDYRLSDPYLDPVEMDASIYSERTIRLPDSFWCYDPIALRDCQVNPLPTLRTGVITFGCLNNFCKINDDIINLWARVLKQVKNSRLLLLAPEGIPRQRTLDLLQREGIETERVEFIPRLPRRAYMESYHRIDIGLDSFPYNGHTTSLDSFWMGVPVVTLIGPAVVGRAGWCQLSNLGLTELAGETADQFVQIAVELANDLPRLKELRSTLRQRMERSPLMDAAKFARNIEAVYRQLWRTWCAR